MVTAARRGRWSRKSTSKSPDEMFPSNVTAGDGHPQDELPPAPVAPGSGHLSAAGTARSSAGCRIHGARCYFSPSFFIFPFLPELRWCSSSLAAEGHMGWMSSGPRGCGCSGTRPTASSCHGCWARADPQGSEGTGDTSPSPLGNCTGWCCAWGVPTSNKARLSPPGGDVASGSRIFSWCPTLASSRCASRGAGSRGSCWKSAAPRLLTLLFHENAFQTATKPRKGGRKKGAEQTEIISCCTLCSVGS